MRSSSRTLAHCLPLAALAFACGGVDFTGRYTGNLTLTGSCSDGSQVTPSTRLVTWTISDADVVTIAPEGGTCGSLTADAAGSVARLRAKACPPYTASGITVKEELASGTLEAKTIGTLTSNDRELSVEMRGSAALSDSTGSATCTTRTIGSMLRQ